MKKLSAILLLTLMVFNLVGYKVVLSYLQQHANTRMAEKLDNQAYDRTSLTEVKVPLHLPYPVNDKEFQRYDGSIEINGITYNYVERKLQNDTLILHCITNTLANNIKKAGSNYSKTVNDFQPVQKGQKNSNSSIVLKMLESTGCRFTSYATLNQVLYNIQRTSYKNSSEAVISDNFSLSPEQPPDMA